MTKLIITCFSFVIVQLQDVVSDSENPIDLKVYSHNIAILRGRDGRDGLQGERGEKGESGPQGIQGLSGGGLIYTRWGKASCPNTKETELIYEGVTTGGSHNFSGGGANYVCLSKSPEYHTTQPTPLFSPLQSAKYKGVTSNADAEDQAAVCAVCYTSIRSAKLMIPGKKNCPNNWTKEYSGYLMADFYGHKHNSVFECIDEDMEGISSKSNQNEGAANLYHVVASSCTSSIPCPPYLKYIPITCVVCTK